MDMKKLCLIGFCIIFLSACSGGNDYLRGVFVEEVEPTITGEIIDIEIEANRFLVQSKEDKTIDGKPIMIWFSTVELENLKEDERVTETLKIGQIVSVRSKEKVDESSYPAQAIADWIEFVE